MKTSIHFAIAQMNPTVGDYPGNAEKIKAWIKTAERQKADLIVFPELALSGYPVWDLANHKGFVRKGLECLSDIVAATKGKRVAVVLGFIDSGSGTDRSFNALAWIQNGRLVAKYYKRLLPTYDVFLEDIFFEPGKKCSVISWKGRKIGPAICEDIWDENYREKPVSEMTRLGADLILNISASPYYRGVAERRDLVVKRHAVRNKVPFLYVNQVGAQDDLIFDGRSFFADAQGRVLYRCPAFKEGLFFFEWSPKDRTAPSIPIAATEQGPEEMYHALTLGVRDYCRKNGFKKVVVGLSGGIDSALVAVLAVDALGAENVLGVTMPGDFSSRGSWEDSKELSRNLGIEFRNCPIRGNFRFTLKTYQRYGVKRDGKRSGKITLAMENLQARLRGMALMYISNNENRLLLSTGNKSELAVGYCTLYGDMAGGLAVLGDVYKTDVYRLAIYRNQKSRVIPEAILKKPPSAELRPNQTDQDSLPPYDALDEILFLLIEKNRNREEIVEALKSRKVSPVVIREVIAKVDHNEYKRRQTPPILRVTEKAWFGRRMPITSRFER